LTAAAEVVAVADAEADGEADADAFGFGAAVGLLPPTNVIVRPATRPSTHTTARPMSDRWRSLRLRSS